MMFPSKAQTYSVLLSAAFCMLCKCLVANEVVIPKGFYHIDYNLQLILVNEDVDFVNHRVGSQVDILSLDIAYYPCEEIKHFENGLSYNFCDGADRKFSLYFTQLPVINLFPSQAIVDEPKVHSVFQISESSGFNFQCNIGIEIRGGSSQVHPKKSYGIEFWHDKAGTSTMDVSLLGMRSDDDWNLQAMYIEPLRVRSKTCFELWEEIHKPYYASSEPDARSSISQKYVEVFINGAYKGIYAFSEQIDRLQLRLAYYQGEEIKGQLFKGKQWGLTTFKSSIDFNNASMHWGGFEYVYPKEIIDWEPLYDFYCFVTRTPAHRFYREYQNYFHVENAIDYLLFINVLKALDNTGKNAFVARYDQDEPFFYVPWDLDATLGLNWDQKLDTIPNLLLDNGFYARLLKDCSSGGFYSRLQARWIKLRSNVFSHDYIINKLDRNMEVLLTNGAYQRETMAWSDYEYDGDHVAYISNWLSDRLAYLDHYFEKPCLGGWNENEQLNLFDVTIYPNPFSSFINFDIPELASSEVKMYNMLGSCVFQMKFRDRFVSIDMSDLKAGVYQLELFYDGQLVKRKKMIKK